MTHQHSPRKSADDLKPYLNEIDRVSEGSLAKPDYGSPQRDAIASCVDGIVGDICAKVDQVRKTLDQIEQRVLQSAAKSKQSLNDHVSVCIRINDEIIHMREVVAELEGVIHEV